MQLPTTVQGVLARYPADCQPTAVDSLGSAGGFSGAVFWRLQSPSGSLCLRRWPTEHPGPERLAWIHDVVRHVTSRGFRLLPDPISTSDGATFVQHDGHLWELTPWLPGKADYNAEPRREKLAAALKALAEFHIAASSFPANQLTVSLDRSPGISERLKLVEQLLGGRLAYLQAAVCQQSNSDSSLQARTLEILSLVGSRLLDLQRTLQTAASIAVTLQPCLRDIWHDHVLFVGDQLSGIVDLGAMRIESVAADVSRLAGSLCGVDRSSWQAAFHAYEAVRPLSDNERQLVPIFDRSQILLAGINWIEWVYVEKRCFADPTAVEKRITDIHKRLVASRNADPS